MKPRGRPKTVSDEEILEAALNCVAQQGYEGLSLRTLSTSLELSHSAVGQRFGTKENVFRQAVRAEFSKFFGALVEARSSWPAELDDLEELRALIHSFLSATVKFPALGQLMNREGVEPSDRLTLIVENVILPQISPIFGLLDRLRASGKIVPISTRSLFFLVAHGAEAPFTLKAFSATFDSYDGALDPARHIAETTDLIMRAITPTT